MRRNAALNKYNTYPTTAEVIPHILLGETNSLKTIEGHTARNCTTLS